MNTNDKTAEAAKTLVELVLAGDSEASKAWDQQDSGTLQALEQSGASFQVSNGGMGAGSSWGIYLGESIAAESWIATLGGPGAQYRAEALASLLRVVSTGETVQPHSAGRTLAGHDPRRRVRNPGPWGADFTLCNPIAPAGGIVRFRSLAVSKPGIAPLWLATASVKRKGFGDFTRLSHGLQLALNCSFVAVRADWHAFKSDVRATARLHALREDTPAGGNPPGWDFVEA